jgi:hypothetical protein
VKKHFSTLSRNLVFGAASLALTACNSAYQVKVDSTAKPQAEQSVAYLIKTANPDLDPDSLRYKEAERLVKNALAGKGLYEAPKPEMADMVVNLDYGISPPKVTTIKRSEPVFQTVPGPVYAETVVAGLDKDGKPIYATILVQGPDSQQYVGDREYLENIVTYEKYLHLSARENKPGAEGQPAGDIWTVDVSTEGENRDLRKALPVLAAATIEYVNKDTQGQKTIKLKDSDKNGPIAFVKQGL